MVEEIAGDYNFRLYSIRAYGDEYYSSQANNLPMVTGRPYRYDYYGNIEFPKGVKVPDPVVDGDAVNKKHLNAEIKKVADKVPNAIVNQRDTSISAKAWVGNQAQKNEVTAPDPYTIYYVIED